MRKLVLFISLLATYSICRAAEPVHFELYADTQKNTGARIITPVTELKLARNQEDYNIGFMMTSRNFCKSMPVEVKFGNLSCSGSLSRLNSPELSKGTSPFSTGLISISALNANLPGYTSFSKSESTFLQLKANNLLKKRLNLSINTWIPSDNSSPVYSAMFSSRFLSNKLTLSASCTAGNFDYNENSSTSWFLSSPYYMEGTHRCSLFQLSAGYSNKSKKTDFTSTLMTAIYESPFGPFTAVYRTDFHLSCKQTELYTSAFLNHYEDVITSSQKKLKPTLQFKTGIISRKPFVVKNSRLMFLKYGANVFTCINLTESEHLLRFNIGAQISTDLTTLSLSISADALLFSTSPEIPPRQIKASGASLQIKNTWYLKNFSPGLTFSIGKTNAEAEADDTMKYKLQLNVTNNAKHKLNGNLSFSISSKEKEITDKKLSAGLSGTFHLKKLTLIGKASYSHNL